MLVLPAELTHQEAGACLAMLSQATHTAADATVVVDATALRRFDSSALAVLLQCRRNCLAQGKGFAVLNLPQRLRDLASLYGITALLPAAQGPDVLAPAPTLPPAEGRA